MSATPAHHAPIVPERIFQTPYEERVDAALQKRLDREAKWLGRMAESFPGEDWKTTLTRRCYLMAEACGEHPLTGQRYYTAADFLGEVERALTVFKVAVPKLGPATVTKLARHELIPNMRLRERMEHLEGQGKTTAYAVALRLGLRRNTTGSGGEGDSTRVERILGMKSSPMGGGARGLRLFMTYEQAVAFADVLGIDYHDLGV